MRLDQKLDGNEMNSSFLVRISFIFFFFNFLCYYWSRCNTGQDAGGIHRVLATAISEGVFSLVEILLSIFCFS